MLKLKSKKEENVMAETLLFLDQNSYKPAVINSKPIMADFLSYVEWSCESFKKKLFVRKNEILKLEQQNLKFLFILIILEFQYF